MPAPLSLLAKTNGSGLRDMRSFVANPIEFAHFSSLLLVALVVYREIGIIRDPVTLNLSAKTDLTSIDSAST